MSGLFTHHKWKEFAIEIFCSNEKCKNIIVIDSRKVTGLIYCGPDCVFLDTWITEPLAEKYK